MIWPEYVRRLPRFLLSLCALIFLVWAFVDSTHLSLEKVLCDVGAAITCAILALTLEPEK